MTDLFRRAYCHEIALEEKQQKGKKERKEKEKKKKQAETTGELNIPASQAYREHDRIGPGLGLVWTRCK